MISEKQTSDKTMANDETEVIEKFLKHERLLT